MFSPKLMATVQLLVVAVNVYRLFKSFGPKGYVNTSSAQAREKFRGLKIESPQAHLVLDGSAATVVLEQISGMDSVDFIFTLYARNHAGEYFLFKSSGGKEFVKHVPHNVAKAVLKDRYIENANRIFK